MESRITARKTISKEVVQCNLCKGEGKYRMNEHHSSFYDTEEVDCWYCDGTGKIIEETEHLTRVTARPWTQE